MFWGWGDPSTPTDDFLSFPQQTYVLVTAHELQTGEQPPATVTRQPLRGELCSTRPLEPGVAAASHSTPARPHTPGLSSQPAGLVLFICGHRLRKNRPPWGCLGGDYKYGSDHKYGGDHKYCSDHKYGSGPNYRASCRRPGPLR